MNNEELIVNNEKCENLGIKRYATKKGITLISLVVTIIILLILAAISIQAITNTGLFSKAKNATNEYEQKAALEIINLKIANLQIYSYDENQRMLTLQELADAFYNDEEIEYVSLESRKFRQFKQNRYRNCKLIFHKTKRISI